MKRILQLVISLGFVPCYFAWRIIERIVGAQDSIRCVVLYYHAVPTAQREAFARQMDALARMTRPINLGSVPNLQAGFRYSAVTFDDFFQNVVDNALPELTKRNIPAAIFVTTEVLGKHADWWPEFSAERQQQIGSLEQLLQLPFDSVFIGSHTLTHPKLPDLSEGEAFWEVSESRRVLEAALKRKITTFSFPFGAFNPALVELCRRAGYERVFTTLPTMAFRDREEFVTGRVKVDPTDWRLEFRLKILGAYQWLPYAFTLKRRLFSSRIARTMRLSRVEIKSEA